MTSIAEFGESVGQEKARHPKGLYILFVTEMWERFSFYTMMAMLTLYLKDTKDGFGWAPEAATTTYANYLMFVYFSPLVGGLIADRKLGYRTTISIGGVFFTIGHILLAFPSVPALYAALTFLVIGNGLFKPNISTMVGNLYPSGSPLRDSAYNIFYMGINIGALTAPIVAEAVKQRYGFHPAFVVAGGGMMIGMTIFWIFQKQLADAERSKAVGEPEMTDSVAVSEDMPPINHDKSALGQVPEWRRISALFVMFGAAVVFWMIFHQNGSTLTYFADKNTDWKSSTVVPLLIRVISFGFVQGDKVGGVISNAIEPIWILVLSYPLIMFWSWLRSRGLEPSTPLKMTLGMFLTALAFLIFYCAGLAGGDTGKVSPWWLIGGYAVLALAELFFSPMGLSLVSKVAPQRMRGLMMGFWFVATAMGNKLTQIGVYWDVWSHSQFFLLLATLAFVTGVVLLMLLIPLKRAMPGA